MTSTAPGRGRSVVAIFWLLLLLTSACDGGGPEAHADRSRIVLRFITDEPVETFDPSRLYERTDAFVWRFDSAADLAAWTVRPEASATLVADGLSVRCGEAVPSLVRDVDFDAHGINAIEVDIAGLRQGPLRWYWKRQGEKFKGQRGLRVRGSEQAGDESMTQNLGVGSHGAWSGRIRRVRLDPTMAQGETVRIEAVRGVRYVAPPGVVESAARKPWKVELDHELRSALLAPPGIPIERSIEVPERARLRFAYGVRGRLDYPMTFRVTGLEDGAAPRTLFEARLDPGADDMTGWREATVSLDTLADRDIRLALETSSTEDWDPATGMPVFANPEILAPAPGPSQPNVVLISIDTLRADHLSLYGYQRQTSPRLDAWATRSGVVFENTVVSAPWTLPSHASLLSGLDSDRQGGANHGLPISPDVKTLPEYLRAAGYRTLAITGGGWMRPDYGFARGVDLYRHWPSGVDKIDELEHGVDRALDWLDRWSEDPFFLFFHTFEVHSPHRRRQPFFAGLTGSSQPDQGSIITDKIFALREEGFLMRKSFMWRRKGVTPRTALVAPDEIQEVVDRYDSAIAFTDDLIGNLLERIEELGLDRNTVIVITSDHGDAFGEKGLASHGYLYDFNLLVPLIIALPGGVGGGHRVVEQVRSIDILPTLLDVLGLPVPATPEIDGLSLRGLLEGRRDGAAREAWSYATSSNRGISVRLSNRQKYIFNHAPWPSLIGREELYDLQVDPGEERDLAGAGEPLREIRQRAVSRLFERLQGLVVSVRNNEQDPLRGTLRGASIRDFRLKVLAPEGAPLVLDDVESEVVHFTIPAGGFGAYLLENAGTEPLEVVVELEHGGQGRAIVDASDLDSPWQLAFSGSGWSLERIAEQPTTGVTVSRHGFAGGSAADPRMLDPQLRAELEALGYL